MRSVRPAVLLSLIVVVSALAQPGASPFIKTWNTNWDRPWGSGEPGSYEVKATKAPGYLFGKRTEATASACNGLYGKLSADGKTWSGVWWSPDGYYGEFTWTLDGKGGFKGSYNYTDSTSKYAETYPKTFSWWSLPKTP